MDQILYKKDSELQLLNNLTGSEIITVVYQGKNYKVQLSRFVQLVLASQPAPEDTRRYFQTVPGYTTDDQTREITIDGTGVAFYDSSVKAIPGQVLVYGAISTPGNSRFDALLLDTESDSYFLVAGVEDQEPATPGYNTQRYLLLAYILVDENGSQVEEPPQTHPRNQDQYLDQGGDNEVSAAQAKSAYLKSLYFAGVYDAVEDLPTPTVRSLALVGTTAISIYVFSVDSAAWTEFQGGGGGSFTHIEPYSFIFDSELDTVSAAITLKGPKTFTTPDFSSNISGISFEVKLDAAGSYTAAADVTALNSWITSNVTTANTKFQFRKVATFTGTGEGSSVIRTSETITLT